MTFNELDDIYNTVDVFIEPEGVLVHKHLGDVRTLMWFDYDSYTLLCKHAFIPKDLDETLKMYKDL